MGQAISALASSMTLDNAVSVLQSSNGTDAKTINFIRESLKKSGSRKFRSASHGNAKAVYTPTHEDTKDYSGGVWDALYKINDMLLETIEKWDLEEIRCKSFERTSSQLQEEIREDLASYIILVSTATADKNEASGKVDFHKGEGDKVENDLREFNKEIII